MWGRSPKPVEPPERTRRNDKYLPEIPLPQSLVLTADETEAAAGTGLIVAAIPTQYLRPVFLRFAGKIADRTPIAITRQRGEGAVLISESEWASIEETLYLLRSPANAKRLLESIAELDAGQGEEQELIYP